MTGSLVRTLFVAWCFALTAAGPALSQPLTVVGHHPVFGPMCAGPLGPGPCAQVQQYILDQQRRLMGQFPPPPPLPGQGSSISGGGIPGIPAWQGPGLLSPPGMGPGGSPQQVALQCARRAGLDARAFAACTGGNLVLPAREHAVLDCAVSSTTTRRFAECAAPELGIRLTRQQRVVADCAMRSDGDRSDFVSCAGSALVGGELTSEQRAVLRCAEDAGGEASRFASCAASRIVGPRLSREQRIAVECAAESGGSASGFATCAGTKVLNLNLNPEQQIAVQCVASTGGQPYAAAGCMATRLTGRELEKCTRNGLGGSDGCFGDNNDLVGRNGWVARSFGQIAGGPNSVVNNPAQIFGGPNSVFNNPGQLAGGPNSIVNNPGQILGGPNSIINNPGQISGGPNSVVNNPGQITGGPNSVINNPGQILGGPNSVFRNPFGR